jgi:cation-transporting P-type ATPase E
MEQDVLAAPANGLTAAEAAARKRRGEANVQVKGGSRGYAEILRTNVFSFFNIILFVIGAALLTLQRYSDALISVGLGLINAMISAAQEIRAKRKLDRLQLLDRGAVVVIRDGAERQVQPEEVVRGDVLKVAAGDQIVVDGPLLDGGRVEADESLLTGESDPVAKEPGDDLRSGSLCVSGEGRQLARDVGVNSYAGRLTAEARRSTTDKTPLQRRIEFIVRLVMVLTTLMSGAILAQAAIEGFTLLRVVQITAVLSGLVPYGLFFLIALAYTAGAVRIGRSGALVQQVNAVESVSNVDVVCTDKTGTLTTGHLAVDEIVPVGEREYAELTHALGGFAHNVTTPNLTALALAAELTGPVWEVRDEVPFASSLRWSGLVTDEDTWVLGAPDALTRACASRCRRASSPSAPAVACGFCCWRAPRRPARRCGARIRDPSFPCSSRTAWSRSATSCVPRSPTRSASSGAAASTSRCSPVTIREPWPRSRTGPAWTPVSRSPAPPWTGSTTRNWTRSWPGPRCSAGSRRSTRNGSSGRCDGSGGTSR